ncbi:hypothetical protein ZWY2020_027309 [Hordeum vulgare]|nr:hypothetical protein ZWY2020_027309 [Hordeum vulgare]
MDYSCTAACSYGPPRRPRPPPSRPQRAGSPAHCTGTGRTTGRRSSPGFGDAEVDNDYRVVFWSPPTGDEVRAAFSSIQDVSGFPALGNRRSPWSQCPTPRSALCHIKMSRPTVVVKNTYMANNRR